eukprot:PhM_4_TR13726/c0_g1_i2/m.33833
MSSSDISSTARDRLINFYRQFNPTKVGEVDNILAEFTGREEELFDVLFLKYASAAPPPVAPSAQQQPTTNRTPSPLQQLQQQQQPPRPPPPASRPPPVLAPRPSPTAIGVGQTRFPPEEPNQQQEQEYYQSNLTEKVNVTDQIIARLRSASDGELLSRTVVAALSDVKSHEERLRRATEDVFAAVATATEALETERHNLEKERQSMLESIEIARSELSERESRVQRQTHELHLLAHSMQKAQHDGVNRLNEDLTRFFQRNEELLNSNVVVPPQQHQQHDTSLSTVFGTPNKKGMSAAKHLSTHNESPVAPPPSGTPTPPTPPPAAVPRATPNGAKPLRITSPARRPLDQKPLSSGPLSNALLTAKKGDVVYLQP